MLPYVFSGWLSTDASESAERLLDDIFQSGLGHFSEKRRHRYATIKDEFMLTIQKLILGLILLMPVPGLCAELRYALEVHIDPSRNIIAGTARLSSPHDREVTLAIENLGNLTVHSGKVITQSDDTMVVNVTDDSETHLSFQVIPGNMTGSFLDVEHVFLTGHWYPRPSSLAEYQLTLKIPREFVAVSEADTILREQSGSMATYRFDFHHPVDAIHLAASSRFTVRRDYFQGIEIETYFFKEDAGLAETYLRHAVTYLQKYQARLTPYPFRRFAIVENILPTGISLPTFTLLGRDVVRLPFIVSTSLGHEILHQWFGNGVYIDSTHGNWAEGLTTYLSDHETAAGEGRDVDYRKQIMVEYEAYHRPETVIPLGAFQYRRSRSDGVIGYGKAAMFFHELQNRLGPERFLTALKDFIHENLFRRASWRDLQASFEKTAGTPLGEIFAVWLNRTDIPVLGIENARLSMNRGGLHLTFDLLREADPPPLTLPISIYTGDKVSVRVMDGISSGTIDMPLSTVPSRVVLDDQYHVMRHLTEPETPPVLAALLGNPEIVAVIPPEKRDSFQPLMEALGIPGITYMTADKTALTELGERNLLIAGSSSALSQRLFGKMDPPEAGVRIRVFKNPFHANQRILVADVASKSEAESIRKKLRHYGKYSDLAFNRGRNIRKEITHAQDGILIIEPAPSVAVVPDELPTLDGLIPELLDKRVVFVGEQHNRFEHHINQLHIIQRFHMAGYDFGVGMEMFKKPFQGIIDAYLADEIDEQTFLNQTHYFKEWGYDFRLYKPIVDFIKKNRIPLIALNLPERITRQVSRSGIEMLDPADRNLIPESLDFSDTRYAHDLRGVFALHNGQEALENFNYFYQAQVVWDETMAETAFRFLREFPRRKLIVLAGNGHLRYHYGIPERLQRRIKISSATVLQDEALERGIADYVLQTARIEGAQSPKLGVAVEDTEAGLQVKSVVDKSPAQMSGLKKDDLITRFNHVDIHSLADLRYGLFTADPGRVYPLQIKRDSLILDMEIELFDFSRLSPHGAK